MKLCIISILIFCTNSNVNTHQLPMFTSCSIAGHSHQKNDVHHKTIHPQHKAPLQMANSSTGHMRGGGEETPAKVPTSLSTVVAVGTRGGADLIGGKGESRLRGGWEETPAKYCNICLTTFTHSGKNRKGDGFCSVHCTNSKNVCYSCEIRWWKAPPSSCSGCPHCKSKLVYPLDC